MAEPKKRTNRSKRGMRRMHQKVYIPTLVKCSHCNELKPRHSVCNNCGYYGSEKIVSLATDIDQKITE